jgi:hypothetical protein
MHSRAGSHVYGGYAGPECCGSCWKSSHMASRARWGRSGAAAAGKHRS